MLPLLLAAAVLAERHLSGAACEHTAIVLARGAPLSAGRAFAATPQRRYVDPLADDSGEGTRAVERMPPCQRGGALSIKVLDEGLGLARAAVWIDAFCQEKQCVVYSAFASVPDIDAHVVMI